MSEPPPPADNVIYVAFGRARPRGRPDGDRSAASSGGDGRRSLAASAPAQSWPAPSEARDPAVAVYSRAEVARILGLDPARVRAWERAGLARPSAEERGARRYTFQDLVALRAAKELVDRGVPVARVRRALASLRRLLPGASPLSELRIVSDGRSVAVRAGATTFDPVSGQLLLDFSVGALRDDVVRALPSRPARGGARTAYDWFLEGCRLDGDDAATARAEAAYRRALELDPGLAGALTNLGMLRIQAGDRREAAELLRRAMDADPGQPEAPYNLGYLELEAKRFDPAVVLLSRAVELDGDFADAHFNLAVALDAAGRATEALAHFGEYLALEPDGAFADVARERLRGGF